MHVSKHDLSPGSLTAGCEAGRLDEMSSSNRSRRCTGVIVDLDGTLADTLRDISNAVNVGLAELGLPPQPMEAVREYVGDGVAMLCRRAMNSQRLEQLDRMVAIVLEQYRLHDLDHTRLYEGVPDMLDGLAELGVPVAVLSNKPQEATERLVRALCGRWRFAAVEGYRTDERKKPDPRTAIEIAVRMGAEPREVWMVGDSQGDIATARAAGMVSVGATWGFRSRAELESLGPDYLIDKPTDLLSLIRV